MLVAAPLFHMNALGMAKFVCAAGASMVLLPQFNARRYVEAIGRFKVTWLTSVPTMLALAVREREALAQTDLSSVQFVRTASAPITQSLIDEVNSVFVNTPWLRQTRPRPWLAASRRRSSACRAGWRRDNRR
jgi:acyl-CoA synthetase (AMP-forming)/AMP-acid ligase II